ncbi:MoaD/ThiS family protein [Kluyvera sichuanensis]|uniref:MoaD/ThiS family protein n=1 Tax=Kluyvera sichuanensis TaxID=2725494 RepID=UPI0039F6DA3D
MNNEFVVDITIPRAIGVSKKIKLNGNPTILDAIKELNQHPLMMSIMKSDTEFYHFVLIYLNGKRIKDSSTCLEGNCTIEIIIPMAGG